ncbi:ABC transporter permease [Stenotrophomonas sp. NPDC047960]|uniref:ABC transporter permease n=1 Tax=Stenotrophomonas sp. NPDC047960 TaxID=3364531 RepID=UPI00371143E3
MSTIYAEFGTSPAAMIRSLASNRLLIWELTKREVISRYRGSVLGLAWSFFNPLLMLAVYTFVFSVVFKARWGQETSSHGDFAVILFVGIIVHGVFAECVNRAPGLVLNNASYVKRVIFPLETLPWVAMGATIFHSAVSLVVLLIAQLLLRGSIPLTALWLPVVILPLVVGTMGVSWLLASLGVYLRDIGQVTGILTTVMLFMAPVLYPVQALPESLRSYIYLNPLTFIIEQSRAVLLWGVSPNFVDLGKYSIGALLVAWLGFATFQKMRRGFADVL